MLSVGTVSDVDEIFKLGRVDLFVFRGNKESSDTDQLEARLADFLLFEEPIDDIDSNIEGFCH